jgi:Domain of unknown function (DU1801)
VTSVAAYLHGLPPERRKTINRIRAVIKKNLAKGFREGMQFGMIGYYVPHSLFPPGSHRNPKEPLPYAALASRKNHVAIHLIAAYADSAVERYLRDAFAAANLRLDMGKCCLRFRYTEEIPLDIIGKAIAMLSVGGWIQIYEDSRRTHAARKP